MQASSPAGDFAGVFEYDGEVGCFYLYRLSASGENGRIDGAIQIVKGRLSFEPDEIEIRWNAEQDRVALFIRCSLWALFNVKSGAAYGQSYSRVLLSNVPIDQAFS